MSARDAATTGLLLSALALFTAAPAVAGPWLVGAGEFHSDIRGARQGTGSSRDAAGDRQDLPGGRIESRSIRWSNEIGWRKRMTFRFDIPFESNSIQAGPGADFTQTGFSDLVVGLKYGLVQGATAIAIEADWKAPMGYNRRLFPSLGDGRQDAIGLLHAGTSIRPLNAFLQVAGGYRARLEPSDDPLQEQNEVLFGGDLGFWIGSSVLVSGTYRSRQEADKASNPEMQTTAGPQVLFRVDDHLDVFAGSLHTISGENVLDLNQYYAGIATKRTSLDRLRGFLGGSKRP